jgi:hypothetical protein
MGWLGGGSAPAPDPAIGQAEKQLADLSTEQWNTFKTDIYPELLRQSKVAESRADEQWAMDKKIATFNLEQAETATKRYEEGAIPAMKALKADADLYNTAGYQEQMAGQAVGDIAAAEEVARQTQVNRDRSYGIDPTSGRSGLGFNANNVNAALAKATAATQTREAAKQLGLQKQANVFNMYAGLPAQANMQTNTALNASDQGTRVTTAAQNATANVGGALTNSANSASSGWGQVGSIGVGKYNADISNYSAKAAANPWNTVLGAAAGVGTKYALGKIG